MKYEKIAKPKRYRFTSRTDNAIKFCRTCFGELVLAVTLTMALTLTLWDEAAARK